MTLQCRVERAKESCSSKDVLSTIQSHSPQHCTMNLNVLWEHKTMNQEHLDLPSYADSDSDLSMRSLGYVEVTKRVINGSHR